MITLNRIRLSTTERLETKIKRTPLSIICLLLLSLKITKAAVDLGTIKFYMNNIEWCNRMVEYYLTNTYLKSYRWVLKRLWEMM